MEKNTITQVALRLEQKSSTNQIRECFLLLLNNFIKTKKKKKKTKQTPTMNR